MSDAVYLVDGGQLTPMQPSEPPDEDALQDLIARHGDLIGRDAEPFLLVRREQGVSDAPDADGRWSLDHLFVTRNAVPVLVEVKRAVDSRLRREVIGQLLDYAANGSAYWRQGALEQSFAASCAERGETPDDVIGGFLDGETPAGEFWGRVEANLRDGRLRMLIVADRIPPELARIVEFLNGQMRAEVLAVELRYFAAGDGRLVLAPRTIGETAQIAAQKRTPSDIPIPREEWFRRYFSDASPEDRAGAEEWLEIADDLNLLSKPISLGIHGNVVTVGGCEVITHYLRPNGRLETCLSYNARRGLLANESVRQAMLDELVEAVGPLSTSNNRGMPGFAVRLLNDPETRDAFRAVAGNWISLCRDAAVLQERPDGGMAAQS